MGRRRELKRLEAQDRSKFTIPENRSTKRQKATGETA